VDECKSLFLGSAGAVFLKRERPDDAPALTVGATGRFRYIAWVKCPYVRTEFRAKRQRCARASLRQLECPYRVTGKASALGA